jgi:hypothetical protein
MNNRLFARVLPAFYVGFLFWSWGGAAGWRTLQMQGMAPYSRVITKPDAAKQKAAPTQREKLALTRRVADAIKDPSRLTNADIAAAKTTWGSDSAKMLQILKDSSQ